MKRIAIGALLLATSMAANAENWILTQSGNRVLDEFTMKALNSITLPGLSKYMGNKAGVYTSLQYVYSTENAITQCLVVVNTVVGLSQEGSNSVDVFEDSPVVRSFEYAERITNAECTELSKELVAKNMVTTIKKTQESLSKKL